MNSDNGNPARDITLAVLDEKLRGVLEKVNLIPEIRDQLVHQNARLDRHEEHIAELREYRRMVAQWGRSVLSGLVIASALGLGAFLLRVFLVLGGK